MNTQEPWLTAEQCCDWARRSGWQIGDPCNVFSQTDSTNAQALQAIRQGAPHGALFIANQQTAGRGRHGRSWVSPADRNLYLSVVLREGINTETAPLVALVAGVAVAHAVERFISPAATGIKWPNDVLIGKEKVAGILLETIGAPQGVDALVAGIGVNVLHQDFPPEISSIATCVADHTARELSRPDVLRELLGQFDRCYREFLATGLATLLGGLRSRDITLGQRIQYREGAGIGAGIDDAGRLVIRVADGSGVNVSTGEVVLIPDPPPAPGQ